MGKMAREVGPKAVHAAYVLIDAVIDLPWTRQRWPDRSDEIRHQAVRDRRGDLASRASGPQRVVVQCRNPPFRRDLVIGDWQETFMTQLRIFSYLPNPRIWKATIAARICGVDIEVRGSLPRELQDWFWDFDARPLSEVAPEIAEGAKRVGRIGFSGEQLFKTDSFLAAHPFGTVLAAFSPDGRIGIFESNSIMRAVARLGHERFALYGRDPYEASRIDSFLDTSLVFARDAQLYLFALREAQIPPALTPCPRRRRRC